MSALPCSCGLSPDVTSQPGTLGSSVFLLRQRESPVLAFKKQTPFPFLQTLILQNLKGLQDVPCSGGTNIPCTRCLDFSLLAFILFLKQQLGWEHHWTLNDAPSTTAPLALAAVLGHLNCSELGIMSCGHCVSITTPVSDLSSEWMDSEYEWNG